jgi:hypothetical protein
MEKSNDDIISEIQQLQNKILELEEIQKQKKIAEENSKKGTFEEYFENLSEFIKIRYDDANKTFNLGTHDPMTEEQHKSCIINILKRQGHSSVPALEHICNALDNINKRLTKLENS